MRISMPGLKIHKVKNVRIPFSYSLEEAIKLFTEAVQVIKGPDPKMI